MIEILLCHGRGVTVIDDADYDLVKPYNWFAKIYPYRPTYAARQIPLGTGYDKYSMQLMHRLIMSPPRGMVVDHIDGDGLNNLRSNMRIVTLAQNTLNQRKSKRSGYGSTSAFKGVCFLKNKRTKPWRAFIGFQNRHIHIGEYDTPEQAAIAYNQKAMELHGEFACLNEVPIVR